MSRVTETTEEQKWGLLQPEAAMASNSLFSTVTPCQQNFFWGEYYFAGCCCVWGLGFRGLGSRGGLWGQVLEGWIEELKGFGGKRILDVMEGFLGPDEWRGSAEVIEDLCYQGPSFLWWK